MNGILKEYRSKTPLRIQYYDTLPSTNTFLMNLGRQGEKEGLVVIADHQSKGKGRLGRSFYSPKGSGLYMSVLLRPNFQSDIAVRITTAAAASVSEAIEVLTGKKVSIKWVNDIYMLDKKVGGILTEGAMTFDGTALDFSVLGIGVNLASPCDGFPYELKDVAGSLDEVPSASFRDRLAAETLTRFFDYYQQLENGSHYTSYRSRLSFLGQMVSVKQGDCSYTALAHDITPDFKLILQKDDGTFETLSSGEISIKI